MSDAASVPGAQREVEAWDQAVKTSTRQFNYEDSTVRLLVGDVKFQVSRRLLSTTSDVFADMFTLPEGVEAQEIVLHNDPEDFEFFLWFLHVDVISMEHYNTSASQQVRFRRALGIATIAHMYSAARVLTWAIAELLKYLASQLHDRALLVRTYRLATRAVDNPNFLVTVRREWINGMQNFDPITMLDAAKSVEDHGILGCAYFVILQARTNRWIAIEPSLTPLDRARLMVGALNLRHWTKIHSSSSSDPLAATFNLRNSDSNVKGIPLMTSWDPQRLWVLFTRSPFGLNFEHDADLSVHDDRTSQTTEQAK